MEWKNTESELTETSKEINNCADILKKLPIENRKLFNIMLDRGEEVSDELKIHLHEIECITGLNSSEIAKHYELLKRYEFLGEIDYDDYGNEVCCTKDIGSGWPFWKYLKNYTDNTEFKLEYFIVDLLFNLLD